MTKSDFIREIAPHYSGPRRKVERIREAKDAVRFLQGTLKDNAREHVIALYLDGTNKPISYSVISIGTANSSSIHPREVFQMAVLSGACALILAHNHPSGDLTPSRADKEVTKRIHESGTLLGISLLDHVIFTDSSHYSFQEHGEL